MTPSEIIKNLRNKKNLTQKELADRLGLHYRTVQNWESGNPPNSLQRKKICSFFKINESELFGQISPIHIKDVKIPVVSMAKGDDQEGFEFESLDPHEYEYIDFSDCKAIKITTNSMAPIAYKGQKIIYCENFEVSDGDLVFIGLRTGEQYFKRYSKNNDGKTVTLEPINVVHYRSKTVNKSQVKFIYKVVGVKF